MGFQDKCKDTVFQMEIKKPNAASAEFINFNSALSQTASLVIIDKTSISVHISEQITKKH